MAETAEGVPELVAALEQHRKWLEDSGELSKRRRQRLKERVKEAVERQLQGIVWREKGGDRILEESLNDLEGGKTTPYDVANRIVATVTG